MYINTLEIRQLFEASSASASGSSSIRSATAVLEASAAAFASFFLFADSFSFSHRSRNFAIIIFCYIVVSDYSEGHIGPTNLLLIISLDSPQFFFQFPYPVQ